MINTGLSSCNLTILDQSTIRKSASAVSGNDRLLRQISKQLRYDKNFDLTFSTAPILRTGTDQGCVYFDMPYIAGASFIEFFATCTRVDLDDFYQALREYLDHNWQDTMIDVTHQVDRKLAALEPPSRHKEFIRFLRKRNTKTLVNTGFCHGDLTLSNILFKPGQYCLIDFLDSHIETPLYDFSKLKQDLYYHWSSSIEHDRMKNNNQLKIAQSINYIWNLLSKQYNLVYTSSSFFMIDALTLLRIEPYAMDQYKKDILDCAIAKLDLYEEFNNTHSRQIHQVCNH
jgi:hypothetical protein